MEATIKPLQNGRGRKRRWPAKQKLVVLQEWKNGILLEEVCWKYNVNAAQMYRWKRSLDQEPKESGELVPKSQVLGLQKRVDELERALERKALEVDLFKKVYELKELRLSKGTEDGLYEAQAVRSRLRAGRSRSLGGGSSTAAGAGVDDRCSGRKWRPRLVGSSTRAPRPTATDGCTRSSRVRGWRAIPRRCGGCCADEAGWPRD